MRRSFSPVFLLPLLCCSVHCGGEPGQRMPVQDEVFRLVQAEFVAVMPGRELAEPDVRWWTRTCPGTSTTAVVLGQSCYSGIYFRAGAVDVAWRGSFGRSAYSHELMHYFLDQAGQGSDPDHQRAASWEAVRGADAKLLDAGL